ncbi:hypothetical protein TWF730_007672 [Orbilia blumenaviensis]|uniref:Uncharacterized protein n=1 Tax=Orbilia blumenaviensis TaxID=1796055 RepID=A0AAV9VBR3_9PEZI
MGSTENYSIPQEALKVLQKGILENPLMKDFLPKDLQSLSKHLSFEGSNKPSIPINWRFAESISALKGLEALMLNLLITKKYNIQPLDITINTDHASLFFMAPLLAQIIKDGAPTPINLYSAETLRMFPSEDKHRSQESILRKWATNIYKTKDGRYYHTHGSMNPDSTLTALKLPLDGEPDDTEESVVEKIQGVTSNINSAELDELMNEQFRQAGTVAYSSDEYLNSEHGKANSKAGLYEISKDPNSSQPATWWKEDASSQSSPKRPLAGLKVVDITRVIASPAIGRGLAEMGASVMRVTSPHLADLSIFHQDLNWGKWNCHLHLKHEEDKEKLRQLIREADVVIDGYRPGAMDRLGFGRDAVFDLVKDRGYGIVYVRENCYGWHGPWSHRSGWQQISDSCCGVSLAYGQAMGNNEAVTPVFPNSDYCTGVCGAASVLHALIERAEKGGSYSVDVALNYYSQWLVQSVGTYDDEIWKELWNRHGSPVFRHYQPMQVLLPAMMRLLYQYDKETLFKQQFFEPRRAENLGVTFVQVKPIAQFKDNAVELRYNVGTRGNGTDQPFWPKDLMVQIVTGDN